MLSFEKEHPPPPPASQAPSLGADPFAKNGYCGVSRARSWDTTLSFCARRAGGHRLGARHPQGELPGEPPVSSLAWHLPSLPRDLPSPCSAGRRVRGWQLTLLSGRGTCRVHRAPAFLITDRARLLHATRPRAALLLALVQDPSCLFPSHCHEFCSSHPPYTVF